MAWLEARYGVVLGHENKNIRPRDRTDEEVMTREDFERLNALDMELYRCAVELVAADGAGPGGEGRRGDGAPSRPIVLPPTLTLTLTHRLGWSGREARRPRPRPATPLLFSQTMSSGISSSEAPGSGRATLPSARPVP